MTEWNYWYGPYVFGELGTRYFLQDGLGIARGLHEYFRHSDIIFMANYAQTVNVIGCVKTSKTDVALETTGQVLRLYRNHFGQIPIAVSGQLGDLDVSAALGQDQRTLTVAVVNPTRWQYTLCMNATEGELPSTCAMWWIAGEDELDFNEPGSPYRVRLDQKSVTVDTNNIPVKPLSVAIYRFNLE